jgi:serine/threonine protein kinase
MLQGKNLKISDFGYVKIHTATEMVLRSAQKGQCLAESLVGSINYIAPDILIAERERKKYNPFKSDVWSMGIILYKMLFGKEPYQAFETS